MTTTNRTFIRYLSLCTLLTAFLLLTASVSLVSAAGVINDSYQNAYEFTFPAHIIQKGVEAATIEANEPLHKCREGGAGTGSNSVWFKFTLTATQRVRLSTWTSTYPGTDGNTDTIMSIFTDDLSKQVACNDDKAFYADYAEINKKLKPGTYLVKVSSAKKKPMTKPAELKLRAELPNVMPNAGFESGVKNWQLSGATKDKVVCNKAYTYDGVCYFQFKGSANENTTLSQTFPVNDIVMDDKDTLYVKADYLPRKGFVDNGATVNLKVAYAEPNTEVDDMTIKLKNSSSKYWETLMFSVKPDGTIKEITVTVNHTSTGGKLLLDKFTFNFSKHASTIINGASVQMVEASENVIPLPAAP